MCSAGQDQAPQPGKDQEKEPQDEKDSAEKKDEDPSKEDDPWGIVPHRHDELTAAEIRWWDVKDQFWKEKVAELQDVEVRNLTFAVPMQSRHSREVVHALEDTSTASASASQSPGTRVYRCQAARLVHTAGHPADQYRWR